MAWRQSSAAPPPPPSDAEAQPSLPGTQLFLLTASMCVCCLFLCYSSRRLSLNDLMRCEPFRCLFVPPFCACVCEESQNTQSVTPRLPYFFRARPFPSTRSILAHVVADRMSTIAAAVAARKTAHVRERAIAINRRNVEIIKKQEDSSAYAAALGASIRGGAGAEASGASNSKSTTATSRPARSRGA